jgi:arginyl-tRNA synthetase
MNYPLIEAKKQIISILKETISKLKYTCEIKLEIPPEEMGDFAFPCFRLAPIVKKSPNAIAEEIAQKIKKNKWIEKIEVKGSYVNFFITKKILQTETIKLILEKKDKYGFLNKKNKKVIVEHTSANPNGPLHVGRARNPIIGDTIVRIFRMAGYNVESQFYLDDMGKQATILAWGYNDDEVTKEIDTFYNNNKFYPGGSKNFTHKSDHQRVGFYQIASNRMKEHEKTVSEINELIKSSENGENKAINLIHDAYNPVLEGIKESLQRINITIDKYVPESDFVKDKSVYEVIKKLQKSEYCKDENGALYIDLETFGITGRNTKFFFLRSDGTTLYATRDIAYHIWKAKQADILVNVLGEDHKLESKQVEIALKLVGAKKNPKVIFYSFVSLPGGKMSTRRGRVVFLDDLIKECVDRAYNEVKKRRESELSEKKMKEIAEIIGIGALRYNIIKVQPEKDIMFKWDEALNFEGNASPFIQYAHARTCGILSKSRDPVKDFDAKLLVDESEIDLIKILAKLPIVIDEACEGFRPHSITAYLFEVASSFNQFYRDCPVLSEENKDLRIARLSLVNATKIVIRNGLDLLGIVAPEEM